MLGEMSKGDAQRVGRSTLIQLCGYAGGCATSTRSRDEGAGPIHSRTSTGTSGPGKPVSATGRQRKAFSAWSRKPNLTDRSGAWQETTTLARKVNRTLQG